MNKENLAFYAVVLGMLTTVLFINNLVMTNRITNKVIQNLKRDYVPGPYDPGFDPDKVPNLKPIE